MRFGVLAVSILFLAGCASISPEPLSIDQRLAAIPLKGAPLEHKLTIRWNAQAVPYLEAGSDSDLAFGLGLVHAHLRGGQLAVLKRISQGRLSEMAGPFTTKVDHALRILDLGHAAPQIEAALPDETRRWLERFVEGMNYYQANTSSAPPELSLLGIDFEPWTVRDVITLSRLAGADVTWLLYFSLLTERRKGQADETLWRRLLKTAGASATSFRAAEGDTQLLQELLLASGRSGSNSLALAPSRSQSGAALLANDPHLGLQLPNFWILAGVKSPSYHAVGMMIPGVPIFGIGRNPHIAWGGTNMRAAASDIVNVSGLDASKFSKRTELIRRRFWPDAEREVRVSPWGPVVSDAELLSGRKDEVLALRWEGHDPSDEITAFLGAARAKNTAEFIAAFKGYAVSPQNILFADSSGTIGQIMAARLPLRSSPVQTSFIRTPDEAEQDWSKHIGTLDLPMVVNPKQGFLASANNRPAQTSFFISPLFSDDERVKRLEELAQSRPRWSVEDFAQIQTDVISRKAPVLRDDLLSLVPAEGAKRHSSFVEQLKSWDGSYSASSRGALLFELLLGEVAHKVYANKNGDIPNAASQWSYLTVYLKTDLGALAPHRREEIMQGALDAASRRASRFKNWGEMHRLRTQHLLARLPVLGRRFVLADRPASGSRETVMKTSHGLERELHRTSYGSQARHLSDLSDPDLNYFALFGGQDGYLGSQNFADQVPLWEKRRYLRLPLRTETVKAEFERVIVIEKEP